MTSLESKYRLQGKGPWLREVEITDVHVPDIRVTSVMPDELFEQFISTIEQQGIVNPIKCIFDEQNLILVDGLHRLQAALKAGMKTVPAVIQKADLKEVMLQNLTSGKLQGRGKVTDMIRVVKYLIEEEKMDISEVALRTGYKMRYLEDLLVIANAHPDILLALDEEKISLGAAKEIARIPDTDAQLKVLWNAIMYRMTIKDVKDLVDRTIEELKRRQQASEEQKPRTPRELVLIECHLCEAKVPAKDMRTVFLCPHCMNIMWDIKLEAKRQLEAEARASSRSVPASGLGMHGVHQGGSEDQVGAGEGEVGVIYAPATERDRISVRLEPEPENPENPEETEETQNF